MHIWGAEVCDCHLDRKNNFHRATENSRTSWSVSSSYFIIPCSFCWGICVQITLVPFSFHTALTFQEKRPMGSPRKNSGGTTVLKSFLNLSLVANLQQHTDKPKFLAIGKVDSLISLLLTKFLPCLHFLFCKWFYHLCSQIINSFHLSCFQC